MKPELLEILCCPTCSGDLTLSTDREECGEVESGGLKCAACSRTYPVIRFIPRFVAEQNYASSFGFQWNRFARTQLDSFTGVPISRKRFFTQSGWTAEEMRSTWVLDVGCGAGRFAEVALETAARVVAIDYSSAADACRRNLGQNAMLHILQANIYELPLRDGVFDFVYCFGVLQHTPDVKKALLALIPPLKHRGKLAVDIYDKAWWTLMWPKYWLRPITKRIPPDRLFRIVETLVPILLPISRALGRVPIGGRALRRLMPVADYEGVYALSEQQLREWAVLDTFDMFAPAYDHPQAHSTLRRWLNEAGLESMEVFRPGHLVGRGTKP